MLLTIKDLQGNEEPLVGFKSLGRNRRINGERVIRLLLFPMPENKVSYPMAQEESIIEWSDGEEYRIKKVFRRNKGNQQYKEIVAFQKVVYDLIDSHQYHTKSQSLTFTACMDFIFAGTGYTYNVVDTFYAQDWENFGDEHRLSLFQKALERYQAEFEVKGTHFTFKQRIGKRGDFQFRYGYNIKTYNEEVDTTSLSTYIEGTGAEGIAASYTSPNADTFGIRHAKPVRDERYTTTDGLLERMKAEIKDTPDVSITIDFVDMRKAGYAFDVPNEGDDVFLIYEPMNVDLEARIVEVDEKFNHKLEPIETKVTLANFRQNTVETAFQQIQKQVNAVVDRNGKVVYNVLPAAIQRATEALQSAQTELEFNNGIIARSKTDPNILVLLNSAGIGISDDGGQTFREAITGNGFVLSAGAIGQLEANNIKVGTGTQFEEGYSPDDVIVDANAQFEQNPTLQEAKIINSDSNFEWTAEGFIARDPNNSDIMVKFTKGGIGISSNGGQSYTTAVTGEGVSAQRFRARNIDGTLANEYIEVTPDRVTAVSEIFTRTLFGINDTIASLYDGNKYFGSIFPEAHGKTFCYRKELFVPYGQHDLGKVYVYTIDIPEYTSVAISRVNSIQLTTESARFKANVRLNSLVTDGTDLMKFDIELTPNDPRDGEYTVPVNIMITGLR